jgi:hypothetical protein
MARLSPEEQQEYEEEAEYHRDNQTVEIPEKHRPSAMERISNAVKGAAAKAQAINNSPTGQAIRRHAERINASEGLGDGSFGGGGSNVRQRAQFNNQPQAQVNQGSSLHPGNRIYVMEGSIVASGGMRGTQRRTERRHRPGFGNDPGL